MSQSVTVSVGKSIIKNDGLGVFSRSLIEALQTIWASHSIGRIATLKILGPPGTETIEAFGDCEVVTSGSWRDRWHQHGRESGVFHWLDHFQKRRVHYKCRHRITTIHDLNYKHVGGQVSQSRGKRRIEASLRRSTRVTCISHFVARDLSASFSKTPPLSVIHNGVSNLSGIGRRDPRIQRPFLFHISRMTPGKNARPILGLAKLMPEIDFRFSGPQRDDGLQLKVLSKEMGLRNVFFEFDISEQRKADLYASCSGFIFPSLAEGFGLPPLEAMAFGKPAFLSKLASLPEVGGSDAWYFENFEPQHMRAVVQTGLEACQRPEVRQAIRLRAEKFSWVHCATSYANLYCSLLGQVPETARSASPAAAELG